MNILAKELTVADFVGEPLKEMLAGCSKMNIAFSSPRPISDYRNGPVPHGKAGLQIVIAGGSRKPIELVLFGMHSIARGTHEDNVHFLLNSAGEAHSKTEEALEVSVTKMEPDLLVTYVSRSAFEGTLDMLSALKTANPNLKIVALTCDCDMNKKRALIQNLLDDSTIDLLLVTDGCGGAYAMGELIEAFIDAWPLKK